jgi:hypothetical protein
MQFRLVIVFLFLCSLVFSQRDVTKETIGTPWIGVHYGLNTSAGNLADRFGLLNDLGIMAGYKTKRNWFFGSDLNFLFGNQLKTSNLFGGLADSYGNITDINGDVGAVLLFSRGYNANISIGKVFPIFGSNPNSGIFIQGGCGYMQYHIRIETNKQVIPQVELDYKKGYDRLTGGMATHQFIGYAFMAGNGLVNFYAGFYALQGFTYNQRNINYDQPDVPVSKARRHDNLYGFRFGWLIPIYKGKPKDFYYN